MENIDILTPLPTECPSFTVDTTGALSVPVYNQGDTGMMVRAGGYPLLSSKDNFTILSMGFTLPESFGLATQDILNVTCSAVSLVFTIHNASDDTVIYIPQIGVTGTQVPLENYEMPYGLYVDVSKLPLTGSKFYIGCRISGVTVAKVSMINVPAPLNETVQKFVPFVKISHNFTMTGLPVLPPT
jgi:hypothetical protein